MRRREFIAAVGSAVVLPVAARAQQGGRRRRIGMLMGPAETDPDGQARAGAFRDAFAKLGWVDGHNAQLDYRWAAGDATRAKSYASDLASLPVDVIMANGTAQLAAAQGATKSIAIVFAQVSDPVGGGFVSSIARPGGNITGCTDFEYSFGIKWLEVLKEIAPNVTRVAVLYDPNNPNSAKFLPPIEAAGSSSGVTVSRAPVRDADDITRAVDALAGSQPGGLIVLPSVPVISHRDRLLADVTRHRLPAVYPYRSFALSGGLTSYGVDVLDMYRGAASYVDRILKGEKPANLPVQFATRFEFVVNLKTAKAIGLTVPTSTLLHATEVIE
jgi:putative tryptophan/tyrosine transport system substrate-binding protein